MRKQKIVRRVGAWGRSGLFSALLLMGAGGAPAWGGPPDDGLGAKGFPTGPTLRSIVSGEESPPPRPSQKPVQPTLGPSLWGQEGGSETRNPFYVGLPPKGGPLRESVDLHRKPIPGEGEPVLTGQAPNPGTIQWSRSFGSTPLSSLEYRFSHQPLIIRGRVLLASTRGQIRCLDAVNGATLWRTRLPESVWASGVADENAYYVVSGTPFVTAPHMMGYAQTRKIRRGEGPGHLYALSLLSGKILWTAEVPGPAIGSPVLEGGKIWVATGNGRLSGFSVEKERKVLDMPLFSSSGWSSPLFVHHWIWLSLEGPTKLVALWPDKKRTVWALTTPPTERLVLFTPTPAFGARRLVTLLLSVDKGVPFERLAIASAVTGHIFHTLPFARKGEAVSVEKTIPADLPSYARVYEGMEGPVVAGQTAVAASRILGRAMAVDIPSGHLFWSVVLPAPVVGPGTVAGLVYILPLRDRVLMIDLHNGHILKTLPLKAEPAPGSPPVIGTTLYLASTDGHVQALSIDQFRTRVFPPPPAPAGVGGPASPSTRETG